MQLKTLLAFLTILLAAWELTNRARAPEPSTDVIGPGLEVYRQLAPDLPAWGFIGFLETTANPVLNSGNYFVAQYALAPRVLLNPFDASVRFVVTGVDAPAAIGNHPRLKGFELAGIRARGVRVFRRADE